MGTPFYQDQAVSVGGHLHTASTTTATATMMMMMMEKKSAAERQQAAADSPRGGSQHALQQGSPELDKLVGPADGPGARRELEAHGHPFVKGRGFLLASRDQIENTHPYSMQDLHKQNQHLVLPATPCSAHASTSIYHGNLHLTQTKGDVPVYTNLSNYNPSLTNTSSENYSTGHVPYVGTAPAQHHFSTLAQLVCPKYQEEPQTVPEVGPLSESPPLSPIGQGGPLIKAERKRLRNRIAASNCRRRKLERIARLEDKVKTLKSENFELTSTASVLREQVVHLKHKVMNHVNNGCQVVIGSSSLLKPEENGSF
ncbi:transcription factor AP-1-like isoform X1 [Scyliorhinus canicula]|uniref:transcription factor AP-1-like isoform X1 n=1 Tax=Scyliorhinus canicula TaxID=7830 RepID=UPI0018F484CA|nr:transcription factor AP-1-like isoform X1 [Scyliorhinus canicula]